MPNRRLEFALSQIEPSDWRTFERFAAEFLAVEEPALRTTAAFSGDLGRDGELFRVEGRPETVFQYSVTESWDSKVKQTLERLDENFSEITTLVYCTCQVIGARGDGLKEWCRERGVALDIRDRSWFVERELTAPQREAASQELVHQFVEPLLVERRLLERTSPRFDNEQSRVAVLHLALGGEDRTGDRNLTKACFEALVRSVLHETTPDSLMSLDEVQAAVRELVAVGDGTQVVEQVVGALNRLSAKGGAVKFYKRTNEYCLSAEERARVADASAELVLADEILQSEIRDAVISTQIVEPEAVASAAAEVHTLLGAILEHKGEGFAAAVTTGAMGRINEDAVSGIATGLKLSRLSPPDAARIAIAIMTSPSDAARQYLRRLADGYTLFAFLRQTPDVQKALLTAFQGGDLWLDTSILLPTLIETLGVDDAPFSTVLRACRDAGISLYVTDGVIEEVNSHLDRARSCARTAGGTWEGSVPFVYTSYIRSGRPRESFASWMEEFRGENLPEDDLKAYFMDKFGVASKNLREYSDGASVELRGAVQEIWNRAHERRRSQGNSEIPTIAIQRLVAHDVENCVGVIELRRASEMAPTGYRQWWLTLDSTAFRMGAALKDALGPSAPPSPAMSPEFLTELLQLGPMRAALAKDTGDALPLLVGVGRVSEAPVELLELADRIRSESVGMSERVVERRIRDAVNQAKWHHSGRRIDGAGEAEKV